MKFYNVTLSELELTRLRDFLEKAASRAAAEGNADVSKDAEGFLLTLEIWTSEI